MSNYRRSHPRAMVTPDALEHLAELGQSQTSVVPELPLRADTRAVHQHQLRHAVGELDGEAYRDTTAERVTDDRCRSDPELVHQLTNEAGVLRGPPRHGRRVGFAEARHVDRIRRRHGGEGRENGADRERSLPDAHPGARRLAAPARRSQLHGARPWHSGADHRTSPRPRSDLAPAPTPARARTSGAEAAG